MFYFYSWRGELEDFPKVYLKYTYIEVWVLTSESRLERRWHPFYEESVGGWRKDEVQWMSLALVGDRKDIQPLNLCTSYLSWNVLSLHSSSCTAVPCPVWEGHGGMVLKRMCGKEKSSGKPPNPGSPGRRNRFTLVHLEGWQLWVFLDVWWFLHKTCIFKNLNIENIFWDNNLLQVNTFRSYSYDVHTL